MSLFFIKHRVKQILRMCGHAFAGTIREQLEATDRQISSIIEQNTSLARTQTALLQSSAYLITTLQEFQKGLGQDASGTEPVSDTNAASGKRAGTASQNLAGLLTMWGCDAARMREPLEQITDLHRNIQALYEQMDSRLSRYDNDIERIGQTLQILEEQLARQIHVEADDYAFANPEVGLMTFLYSYLPSGKALDIGAHVGNVSERLLTAGYEVYAFEPYVPTYEKLVSRLGENKAFHHFNFALGQSEAELPLHLAVDHSSNGRHRDITQFNSVPLHSMPDDLPFTDTVLVPMKALSGLQPETVPEDVGLVKIDTEGYDLEVIRGMGDRLYSVVVTEFWDTRMPFGASGLLYTLDSMVGEMRSRGYRWHIVLYRVYGREDVAFYCNHERPIPASWGNIFFFREHETFAHAAAWCAAVLPRTYFKPAPTT